VAHRNPVYILHALCTMQGNGTNAQPLRYTTCGGKHCPSDPSDPGLIAWTRFGILYQSGGAVYRIVPGSKPQHIASPSAVGYVTNPAGTRFAAAPYYECDTCAGPLTIYDARTGAVVGKVGGKKLGNVDPSLSPDGSSVAFGRYTANQTGKSLGIWAANANGSSLRRLVKVGLDPLWSPASAMVAYQVQGGSLHLVSAAGGKSRTLVPGKVENVFGWSPNGRYIAFAQVGRNGAGKLAVVNVATRKVRTLLGLNGSPTASWAPDSHHLVVNSVPRNAMCGPTYRVSLTGSAPVKIASCTS
jgi:hypothetical protein